MRLVDRLRHRADSLYGSEHEELRGLLNMAADRIEAAGSAAEVLVDVRNTFHGDGPDGIPSPDGAYWLGHGYALRIHDAVTAHISLVREQDGE